MLSRRQRIGFWFVGCHVQLYYGLVRITLIISLMRRILRTAWQRWMVPSVMSASFTLSTLSKNYCNNEEQMEPEVEATAQKIFFSPDQCEYTDLKIFSLNADDLGHEITAHLDIALGRIESRQFADGEISLQILDSVSGHKVFIIKSFAGQKINDGIMELILAVSSMKKSGASNITVIVPYFPYSKVETGPSDSTPSTFFAADIAKLIEAMGCDLLVTFNAQLEQFKGFTDKCPFINIDCTELVVPYLIHKEIEKPIIIGASLNPFMSEQIYNLRRTFKYFDLKCDVGFYFSDEGYIGDNIKGRDVILFENILRTGQKLKNRALDLKAKGARSIYAFSIHSLTQGHDLQKLVNELPVKQLILTNTIQQCQDNSKLRHISVSKYVAEMISLIDRNLSLSEFRNQRAILKMAFVEKIRRYAASDLYANEHKEDEDKAVHKESL